MNQLLIRIEDMIKRLRPTNYVQATGVFDTKLFYERQGEL